MLASSEPGLIYETAFAVQTNNHKKSFLEVTLPSQLAENHNENVGEENQNQTKLGLSQKSKPGSRRTLMPIIPNPGIDQSPAVLNLSRMEARQLAWDWTDWDWKGGDQGMREKSLFFLSAGLALSLSLFVLFYFLSFNPLFLYPT